MNNNDNELEIYDFKKSEESLNINQILNSTYNNSTLLNLNYTNNSGLFNNLKPDKNKNKSKKDLSKPSNKTLNVNTERIKNYISRIILYPRKKNDKKPQVKEATQEQLNTPEAKEQNKSKVVIEFPKEEPGYEFANVTKEMTDKNIYQLQRKEIKTAKGFYKRLEESKKKAAGKK